MIFYPDEALFCRHTGEYGEKKQRNQGEKASSIPTEHSYESSSDMFQNLGAVFARAQKILEPVALDLAQREAECIIEHVCNIPRKKLYTQKELLIDKNSINIIDTLLNKRLTGMPLAYALGEGYFYSQQFYLSPEVLIPRPDTETIIEAILEQEPSQKQLFLDICTGSGNIATVLCRERPTWSAFACDISMASLKIAKKNCPFSVRLFCGDMITAIHHSTTFDFIVSNPPYLSKAEMTALDPSVSQWEPQQALFGGDDGLAYYRILAQSCQQILKKNGRLYCEIGYNQFESCRDLFVKAGWSDVCLYKDLGGRTRVVQVQKS